MIPFSSVAMDFMEEKKVYPRHLPLLDVAIDFENGTVNLEGDWKYIMHLNGYGNQASFGKSRERVQMALNVRGTLPVDLADISNDGLLLPLDGVISDHFGAGNCTGLLVIENAGAWSGAVNNDWDITVYLYDRQQNNMEIKIKVPLLTAATNFFEYAN